MKTMTALLLGILLGVLGLQFFAPKPSSTTPQTDETKPLYWVAPMDENYRRDEPGLSPMGMELVPVYASDSNGPDRGPGTININPKVENQLSVKVSQVFYGPLNLKATSQGILRYADTATHHIHTKTTGWLRNVKVKSHGDRVEKGQLLYRLYAPDWVNAQQELLMAMKQENSDLIEAAEHRLTALQFPIHVIKQIKKEGHVIENIPFYAKHSGFVTQLNVQSGHVAKPNETLMVITDMSDMWLDVSWFSQDATDLRLGTKITASSDYFPTKTWAGEIEHIYPKADAQNRSIMSRITLDNTAGLLKAGMSMTVQLNHDSKNNVLLVPRAAVIQTAQQNRVVLSLGQGAYKSITVQLGQQNDRFFEVHSGLKAGDQVVTSAQFLLDSESSKSSDFIRMEGTQWPWAEVTGIIQSIDLLRRELTIKREAIVKWNRPAATVRFVAENNINLKNLSAATEVKFQFEIRDGDFFITKLEVINDD